MAHLNQDETECLEALYRYEVLGTKAEAAFVRLVTLAAKVFAVPMAHITLIDRNRQWFKACYGHHLKETSLELSSCVYAVQNDGVMVVPDTSDDPRFAHHALVTGRPHIRFW